LFILPFFGYQKLFWQHHNKKAAVKYSTAAFVLKKWVMKGYDKKSDNLDSIIFDALKVQVPWKFP